MPARWLPSLAMLIALAFSLVWTEAADARLERGLSFAGGGVFGSINFDDVLSFDNSLQLLSRSRLIRATRSAICSTAAT